MKRPFIYPDLRTELGRCQFRALIELGILRGWIRRPSKAFNWNRNYEPIQGLDTTASSRAQFTN